jgi:hypothetical protein
MTDDDRLIATYADPTFHVAASDVAALADEIYRAAGRAPPFDTYTLKTVIEHVAAAYRMTRWMAERGHLGADTLDKLNTALPARLLDLLSDEINQTRLIPQLIRDGFGGIPATFAAYETTLKMLTAIRSAAPRAHQGLARRRPEVHPEVNEAFRTVTTHFRYFFGDENLRGRAAWTRTKPPRPKHPSAVFIHGVMKLAAPDRPNLAEELRELMDKEVAALPGPRPGRTYR